MVLKYYIYMLSSVVSMGLMGISCASGLPEYDATGTFEATEVVVSSEVSGRILTMNVEEGMQLSKGTEVVLIDTVQLSLKRRQFETSMWAIDRQQPDIHTQIAFISEQIVTAKRELQRARALLEAGVGNRKTVDDCESQLMVLQRQLKAQESTLSKSSASLLEQSRSIAIQIEQIDDQLAKCHVCAPIEGTIMGKYAEAGELAGMGTPLFKIANLRHMFLRAYITSEQLAHVKVGDEVTVYADYGTDEPQSCKGTVSWISSQSEFTPKTILTKDERASLVYAIKVSVDNPGFLKVGMYGGIRLNEGER